MFAGILIVVIFLIFAALMMTRKLPALLALPAMAVVVGLVAGVFYDWSNSEST
jgi:H+/gluconate symporter-like permease